MNSEGAGVEATGHGAGRLPVKEMSSALSCLCLLMPFLPSPARYAM